MEVTVVIVTLSAQTPLVHIPVPARGVIMGMADCANTVSRITTTSTSTTITTTTTTTTTRAAVSCGSILSSGVQSVLL